MEQRKEQLAALWKRYQYVLIVLAAGVFLLLFPTSKEKTVPEPSGQSTGVVFDLDAFQSRLAKTLSAVDGVGQAEVVLSVRSGGRTVLAENQKNGENSSETTAVILSKGSGQQAAVTIEVLSPEFQGALVVCDGGGSPAVRLAVVQAVSALTGLDAGKISVCARAGGS